MKTSLVWFSKLIILCFLVYCHFQSQLLQKARIKFPVVIQTDFKCQREIWVMEYGIWYISMYPSLSSMADHIFKKYHIYSIRYCTSKLLLIGIFILLSDFEVCNLEVLINTTLWRKFFRSILVDVLYTVTR